MGGLDQGLQILGSAIGGIGRIGKDTIVTPVPTAGEIRNRHDFNRCNAECNQIVEPADRRPEGAFRSKGTDMHLIDDRFLPSAAAPVGVAPHIGRWIGHLAWSVHVLRLKARGRVWDAQPVRQYKTISCPGVGSNSDEFMPALAERLQSHRLAVELNLDFSVRRSPESEANLPVGFQLGTERHAVSSRCHSRGLSISGRVMRPGSLVYWMVS